MPRSRGFLSENDRESASVPGRADVEVRRAGDHSCITALRTPRHGPDENSSRKVQNVRAGSSVKSAFYLQPWHQDKLSKIGFGIQPTRAGDPLTNRMEEECKRQADVYVFCILDHRDPQTVDPLDLDQWLFYVIATSVLDDRLGPQKRIGLSSLRRLDPEETDYQGLASAIRRARAVDGKGPEMG